MPKANPTDPLTMVQNAMAAAVAASKAQQDVLVSLTQVESEKMRSGAIEALDATAEAQQKSLDATVTAARAAINGLVQVNALSRDLLKGAADAPAVEFKKMLGARTAMEAVTAQVELVKASQTQAATYASAVAKLVQEVVTEVMKPVQAQVADNLTQLGKIKAL